MTKKPSDKNKAWEKERRDRLNKAFDQLAKLLPQYDPTVAWSKNEIIQKSIAYIEELHKKHESILQEQDPAALREYKELLDTLKFFKSRNGQLAELLNKAKITIPPAKFPKFLIDNPGFGEEEKGLEITTRPVGRPKKYDNKIINAEVLAKVLNGTKNSEPVNESEMPTKPDPTKTLVTTSAPVVNSTPLQTGAIISTGVLLPLIPCRPAPFLPTSNPSNVTSLVGSRNSTVYRKCNILSIQTLPRIKRLPPRTKDGKVAIMPRPTIKLHVRRNDGKIAIPVLKRKVLAVERKRRRRRKLMQPAAEKKTKKRKLPVEKEESTKEKLTKTTESEIIDGTQNALPLTSTDLPEDYFATLQIPENNSNPSSVSPTAAFLLSFPVVSTAGGGKNTDGSDETSAILGDEQQRKAGGVTEGLENLNNFFSTKEYYKYCGDGAAIAKESGVESNLPPTTMNSKIVPQSITSEQVAKTSTPTLPVAITWTASESCKVSSVISTPILSTAQSTVPLHNETFSVNSFVPKVSYAVSSSISSQNPVPICFPASSRPAPSIVSAVPSVKTDPIPSSRTNSCSYSAPNSFPPSQSSNFSVSNIFPSSSLPAVTPKESTQPIAIQSQRPTNTTFSQNIPFIRPQSTDFSRPSYQPNNLPVISSKPTSTPVMATSIFNSTSNPGTFSLPLQTSYSSIPPSSSAVISSSSSTTNSIRTTKSMQFTDYSSTFMTTVAVAAPTRSYSSKNTVRPLNQNSLRTTVASLGEATSSGKPLSFPISYNFGPCAEAPPTVKSYTKSLHANAVSERLSIVSQERPVPSACNTFATPLVTQTFIDSLPRSNDPINVTSTGNYYFPLQAPASVTSTFTFNLTSTVSTAVATTAPTSLAQPFLTYHSVKPAIPWIPATAAVDYKPSFTFSLTPSSMSFTTSSCQNVNSSGPVKSFATLPAVKPSETIAKTTFDPFHSAKPLNPYPTPTAVSNSYTSTNFTFSLAKPKNTVTVATDFTKALPSCSTVDPKYQASAYHPYNFENYANAYPKETTNFTFALTKPTQSFSSSFSIDATLGVTSSYSTHTHSTISQSNDFHKNRTAKSNHYTSNPKSSAKDATTTTNYYNQEQHKLDKVAQKSHVNWMTSSEAMQPMDIGHQATASYYATHITPALDFNTRKLDPTCTGHGAVDENFTAWSPSKILDTSHLMQSTAPPNYYNDLSCVPPIAYDNSKSYSKPYGLEKTKTSATNQGGNFFSVSQLVDQTASSSKACEVVGYQKKTLTQKSKDCRKSSSCNGNPPLQSNMYTGGGPKPSNTLNNYSAEALISKKEKHRNYHPPALHHNSADYYPPPQHDSVNQMTQDATENLNYNSNYFYNYMPPNQNFAPEADYLGAYSGEVQYGKLSNASMGPKSSLSAAVKSEKRLPPPAPPPNLMTYDSNYLPVPPLGAPPPVVDAYEPHPYSHSNNFQHHGGWNPKSALPTYHHHHGQGMLSAGNEANLANSGGGGVGHVGSGNLTNFNLSTICPEINDKVGQTNW